MVTLGSPIRLYQIYQIQNCTKHRIAFFLFNYVKKFDKIDELWSLSINLINLVWRTRDCRHREIQADASKITDNEKLPLPSKRRSVEWRTSRIMEYFYPRGHDR